MGMRARATETGTAKISRVDNNVLGDVGFVIRTFAPPSSGGVCGCGVNQTNGSVQSVQFKQDI